MVKVKKSCTNNLQLTNNYLIKYLEILDKFVKFDIIITINKFVNWGLMRFCGVFVFGVRCYGLFIFRRID